MGWEKKNENENEISPQFWGSKTEDFAVPVTDMHIHKIL